MSDESDAERLLAEGSALHDAGDLAGTERAYRAAAEASPDWIAPHYNLGLLCKYQLRWEESFAHNQRAAQIEPDDESAQWNLGIAATALGRWGDARRAWRACGIDVAEGEGPPELAWGSTPVRLDPDGEGEVVWSTRLDPARARIDSVPLPTSEFRWGDIVLTDGAAEGERVVDGRTYTVFNVLQRLSPSGFETFVVELASVTDAAVEQLEAIAHAWGGAAEHWGSATRILCRACSHGVVHEHADDPARPAHPHCGIAARSAEDAGQVIARWLAESDSVDVIRWYAAKDGAA